jgi:spore germination protein KB
MFQEQEKISGHQAFVLLWAAALGNIFVVMSVPAVDSAGRDGWIPVLLAYLMAAPVGLAQVKLGLHFPKQTIVQYLPAALGPLVGRTAAFVYFLMFWVFSAVIYRETAELIATAFLPQTPIIVVMGVLALTVAYTMKQGFEVFARTTEVLVPALLIMIALLCILVAPEMKARNLLPALEYGILPVLKGIPRQLAFALESVLVMGLWLPCVREYARNQLPRKLLYTFLPAGVLLSGLVAGEIAVFGPETVARLQFPVLSMTTMISIAWFFERIESVFMALWITSSYMQIMIFSYPAVVGLAQWFHLKDYRVLILPMTAVALATATVPANVFQAVAWNDFLDLFFVLPLALLVPAALFICSRAQKRRRTVSGKAGRHQGN